MKQTFRFECATCGKKWQARADDLGAREWPSFINLKVAEYQAAHGTLDDCENPRVLEEADLFMAQAVVAGQDVSPRQTEIKHPAGRKE